MNTESSLLKCLQVTLNFSFNRSYFPRDPSKHWSNVGCHKNYSTEQYTICHCYHLTSYGLIMDVHGIYVRYTLSTPHSLAFFIVIVLPCFTPPHSCLNALFPGPTGWDTQGSTQVHFSGWMLCFDFLLHSFSSGILICNVRSSQKWFTSVLRSLQKFRTNFNSNKEIKSSEVFLRVRVMYISD